MHVSDRSGATTKAVKAALEMAEIWTFLPVELQPIFHMQIAIGAGRVDSATLSAGTGRFFVVDGHEVSDIIHLVHANIPLQLQCPILISNSAREEVVCAPQPEGDRKVNGGVWAVFKGLDLFWGGFHSARPLLREH